MMEFCFEFEKLATKLVSCIDDMNAFLFSLFKTQLINNFVLTILLLEASPVIIIPLGVITCKQTVVKWPGNIVELVENKTKQ